MSLLISAKRETGFVDFFWFWSDCACSRRLFYSAILIFQRAVPIACTHLTNALNFDYTAYTPLRVYDWPHETTPENLARNRRGFTEPYSECLCKLTPPSEHRQSVYNSKPIGT